MKRLSWSAVTLIALTVLGSAVGFQVYKHYQEKPAANSVAAQTALPSARPVTTSKSPSAAVSVSTKASAQPTASAVKVNIQRSQIVASCDSNHTPALSVEVRKVDSETRISVTCETGRRTWTAVTEPLTRNYSGTIQVGCQPPVVKVSAAKCSISNP